MVLGRNIVRHGGWFRPGMDGESELVMVDGEDLLGLEVEDDFLEVLGGGVDIFPIGIVLSVFQERQVHGAETIVYLGKAFVVASVAADIDLTTFSFDHERRPERLITFAQQSVAKMPTWQAGN